MTVDEYANKFLEMIKYFKYIIDDKVNIQHFLSGLSQSYKDIIEFDEPQTLDETIRKAKYCYDKNKSRLEFHQAWKDKKNENFDQE